MKERGRPAYIVSRARRLLVPYFVIGLLYIPVKLKLSDVAVKPFKVTDIWKLMIGQNPDVSLWFLYRPVPDRGSICALVRTYNFHSSPYWYGSFS